jgi:1,4-dihydroxy-2-naphthoyl-CoA hydrolase
VSTPRPWSPGGDLPAPLIPLERTFEGFLGLDWVELTEELAHVRFEIREDLKQPLGLLHGGIYPAVAETLGSVATAFAVWKHGFTASGMSNSASFLRPATTGTLKAISRRRSREEDRWVWSTDFLDDYGRLYALVDVTIAVRPR